MLALHIERCDARNDTLLKWGWLVNWLEVASGVEKVKANHES